MKSISVNLSAPQSSCLGKALADLYYKTNLLDLLDTSKVIRTGFPHNGGMHTLTLTGEPKEIIDFLRVLVDAFDSQAAREIFKVRKALLQEDRVVYMKLSDKNLEV